MSKLMVGSSVLREWIEAPDGDKECTELYSMIEGLRNSILRIVKVQAVLGFRSEENDMLQYVNSTIVCIEENLQKLFNEVQDQIVPYTQKGGKA